jgi:CheY-like chemotaxis protein
MLNHLGYEVDVVENGLEAVKSVVSHPPDYYRLVLLDLEMPVLGT